jgi:hypothetical protein
MKTIEKFVLPFFACLCLLACGEKKDPKLVEAFEIHKSALAVYDEVKKSGADIDALREQIKDKIQALETGESAETDGETLDMLIGFSVDLRKLQEAMEEWHNTVPEVPGFEHEHHHDHDHDHHHHAPAPNVTPEQMIDIQKTALTEIQAIKADLEEVLTQVKLTLSAS